MRFALFAALVFTASASPKVWIFNGDPGDEEHHEVYQKNLADLRKTYVQTFGVPPENVRIFYGPRESGYDGVCTREIILAELRKAAEATREEQAGPVWIIFQGHANSIPGGALFNLPGPDVSPREIAAGLKDAKPETPLVILVTIATSESFLRPLAAPGRIVVTANSPGDPENETDFPVALTAALAAKSTDSDHDGFVSVTELFKACHAQIEAMCTKAGYMIREHPQMDGNGDGRASRRPAIIDGDPASKVGLRIGGEKTGPKKSAPGFD